LSKQIEPTAMQEAMGGCAKLFGYGVVGMALIFADIAFLVLIGSAFGSNPVFQAGAFLGAFTTSASMFGLLVGKARWFRPGPQLLAAYGATILEGVVMALNVALCYAIYRHTDSNIVFQVWEMICPWTPLIAAGVWIVLFQLDPAQKRHHDQIEQEDKQIKAELSYDKLIFDTRMKVKRSAVTMLQTELEQEIVTPERRLAIQQAAQAMADTILSDMSGQHIFVRRTTVQGSGYALPQSAIGSITSSEPEEQENPSSGSIIDKAKNLLWRQPKQQPPAQSDQPAQPPSSMPVQINAVQQDLHDWLYTYMGSTDQQKGVPFLSWLEDLGADHVKDATMALARRLYPVKPSQASPLQQPQMKADQAGTTNGQNGHTKQ
jgi:hypothetical protein